MAGSGVWTPVNTIDEAFADEQVKHRNLVRDVPHPAFGTLKAIGWPYHFSGTPVREPTPEPALGGHRDAVLREKLGLAPADIERLEKSGAFGRTGQK